MSEPNILTLTDVYKTTHYQQYPKGTTKIVSYLTPRMSRVSNDKVVLFGIQYFVLEYLIKKFNQDFFSNDYKKASSDYLTLMTALLGDNFIHGDNLYDLWELGYLPLEISALPEGTEVPMGVPCIQITNTDPNFAWLVNYIEPLLSCTLWHMMTCATVAHNFRNVTNRFFDNHIQARGAISDFSMRGQESMQSAITSSAAFLLSFDKTSTIPALSFLEEYYSADINNIATGLTSTEHSVMCSNAAVDGDEEDMIIRLLTEIYPKKSFSMVADSYDYWNVVDNIMSSPKVKRAVLEHEGFIGIRGDSGDPVQIVTQTVYHLWKIYGGTIDSKGLKHLDPHVKAVYGDSITVEKAHDIYNLLINNGFAPTNVALGMGSYSLQSFEGQPMTRDTFSIAVKATYCEVNGVPYKIYKDPKTDTGKFKKSHKGMCAVYYDENGNLACEDGFDSNTIQDAPHENLLTPIFRDGICIKRDTLDSIRNRLNRGEF